MSLERICYIVNPSAKGGKAFKIWNQYFEPELKPRKKDIYFTEKERTEDLTKSLLGDYDVFVAAGGDGHLRDVANGIAEENKILGIAAVGTANDLFRSLTGMNSDSRNYGKMIDIIKNRKINTVDLCKATFDGNERYYLTALDFGIVGEVVKNVSYDIKKAIGKNAYVLSILKSWNYKPFEAEIKFNSSSISQRCIMLSVNNIPSKASWFIFAPEAKFDDGYLDVVFVDNSVFRSILYLPSAMKGDHINKKGICYFSSDKKIQSLEIITEPKVPFSMDGDLAGETPVKTEIYGKLKVLSN